MQRYFLAFWNLENLFAPEGHPDREPWLAEEVGRDLKGWSQVFFDRKIEQLSSIISLMDGGAGPDLLGVCEVEMAFVLNKLCGRLNTLLPGRNYGVVHVDSTLDHRGIDTAFVFDRSKLTPITTELFSHFVMRRTGTRDITQVTFQTNAGNQFVALANHWPSRSGGHWSESQGFRMTAGETLGYWHERIREEKGSDIAVVAMGDLNDEPGDQSVVVHANASRERDDIENAESARFYNLAWRYLRQPVTSMNGTARTLYGTIYYSGNGFLFDQVLVSRSLLNGAGPFRIDESTARIEAFPQMVSNSKNSGPIPFGLPKGNPARNLNLNGYADHFPVSVVLDEA